ncbi:MAG: c-type cytochrome biogenesis protein CcsB [Deltaproteobacteria bacterium]|nr:MAG: c-type cytochrome biogenesis protein CcsB [Deltaproteobacteria bacterium]
MLDTVYGALMLLYLGVGLLFLAAGLWASPALNRWARVLFGAGLAAHSAALLGRWWESYHLALGHTPPAYFSEKLRLVILQAPMSNFYESLVFFAWCLPFLAILTFRRYLRDYLGTVVAIAACLLLAYASLGGVDSRIKPLMPALKSNWLLFHVLTCFLGYASFTLGFGVAILYLVQEKRPRPTLPSLPELDRLIYQATVIGFLLLTLGILTGAVWAETAWGRYWSWDPKETWSLITWLVYATLLHARLVKGWQGRRIAWLAVLGFAAVLFTYFGVSFLLPGLHSYLT